MTEQERARKSRLDEIAEQFFPDVRNSFGETLIDRKWHRCHCRAALEQLARELAEVAENMGYADVRDAILGHALLCGLKEKA